MNEVENDASDGHIDVSDATITICPVVGVRKSKNLSISKRVALSANAAPSLGRFHTIQTQYFNSALQYL